MNLLKLVTQGNKYGMDVYEPEINEHEIGFHTKPNYIVSIHPLREFSSVSV